MKVVDVRMEHMMTVTSVKSLTCLSRYHVPLQSSFQVQQFSYHQQSLSAAQSTRRHQPQVDQVPQSSHPLASKYQVNLPQLFIQVVNLHQYKVHQAR